MLPGASAPEPSEQIRVVTWNIHYGYGPCFDTGSTASKAEVLQNLEGIAATLRSLQPDLVALQEVDVRSTRVRGIDQLAWLQEALGMPWAAFTLTWDLPWVPSPGRDPRRHWGRARSGQAVLSRFPLSAPVRHALPQPACYGRLYNRFYLHRAAIECQVDLGPRRLRVLNVHTEAFDRDNCSEHARRLAELVRAGPVADTLLLGDLNSVPPEARVRHAFKDEPLTDMRGDQAIATLRAVPGLHEVAPAEAYAADEARWFTFPAWEPNRRLDYLFYGHGLELLEARVPRPEPAPSDHLPVCASFTAR